MKHLKRSFFLFLLTPLLCSGANLIRLDKHINGVEETLHLASGETAEILYARLKTSSGSSAQSKLIVTIEENEFDYTSQTIRDENVYLVGPLSLRWESTKGEYGFVIIKKHLAPSATGHGSTISIPSHTDGEVAIILESSEDLLNWTTIHEGTYDSASDSRFFRLRASQSIEK